MVDIKRFVDFKNRNGLILSRDDIHNIFLKLSNYFDCRIKGFVYTHSKCYPAFVTNDYKTIFMNYDSLIKYYTDMVMLHNKDNKYDSIALINYYIVFALIHEFVHGLQMDDRISPYRDINSLYELCFQFIGEDNLRIKRILNNVIYQKLHDYFAIEINANVLAYEYMFYIVDDNYRDYFMRRLYEMIRECYMNYNLYDMYRNVLGLQEVEEFNFDMSVEDKIKYGLFLTKDERLMLSSTGNVNLAKVINCKLF